MMRATATSLTGGGVTVMSDASQWTTAKRPQPQGHQCHHCRRAIRVRSSGRRWRIRRSSDERTSRLQMEEKAGAETMRSVPVVFCPMTARACSCASLGGCCCCWWTVTQPPAKQGQWEGSGGAHSNSAPTAIFKCSAAPSFLPCCPPFLPLPCRRSGTVSSSASGAIDSEAEGIELCLSAQGVGRIMRAGVGPWHSE